MSRKFDPKKVVWLMGGLGNVLFQAFYAFVLRANGYEVVLCDALTRRGLGTAMLGWTIHQPSYRLLLSDFSYAQVPIIRSVPAFIEKKLGLQLGGGFHHSGSKFIPPPDCVHVFGYFQEKDEIFRYEGLLSEFCALIRSRVPLDRPRQCVIHFRAGDSRIGVTSGVYYEYVREKATGFRDVTVVTDDYRSATKVFAGLDNIKILTPQDPLIDFAILLSAKHLFCAPSTFSWWALHCSASAQSAVVPAWIGNNIGVFGYREVGDLVYERVI